MPTNKMLHTLKSLPLYFSFLHKKKKNDIKCLRIIPSSELAMNYRGYLQTEGTGVEKGRTHLC